MFVRNLSILVFLVLSINTAQAAAINTGDTSQAEPSQAKPSQAEPAKITPELTPEQQLKRMHHASPMPNLMRVAMKNKEALKLDEAQVRNLEFWRNRQSLVAKRLVKEISELEAGVHAASLAGRSTGYLINQMSVLLSKRMKLASQKILCRDNMMHVLTPEQWAKVVDLYQQ